jgi:hypothetical protein
VNGQAKLVQNNSFSFTLDYGYTHAATENDASRNWDPLNEELSGGYNLDLTRSLNASTTVNTYDSKGRLIAAEGTGTGTSYEYRTRGGLPVSTTNTQTAQGFSVAFGQRIYSLSVEDRHLRGDASVQAGRDQGTDVASRAG